MIRLIKLTGGGTIGMPEKDSATRIMRSGEVQSEKTVILHLTPNPTEEAMRFYSHQNAYAAFVVWHGRFLFVNGNKTEQLCRGDFVFIPPGIIYGYQPLVPQSELLVLTTLEDPAVLLEAIDQDKNEMFQEPQKVPNLANVTEVHSHRPFDFAKPIDQGASLSTFLQPYSLDATTCSRWIFGGVIARPFVRHTQCEGKFSVSALVSSRVHRVWPFLNRWLSFTSVDHCFCVIEGMFLVKLRDEDEWTELREGQAIRVPARQRFTADVGSEHLNMLTFTNGVGIDELICKAGHEYGSTALPETVGGWDSWDELRLRAACSAVGALLD
ncbi:cupin domain-containing [Fusarium longipes]|uniref:Cupin domain-containing n=1 Tax=Fusarium longipes TaxID=694270 RepID=A0A395T1N4_9HYPO|nr:cupin domain-containing [Fusarium longipes]